MSPRAFSSCSPFRLLGFSALALALGACGEEQGDDVDNLDVPNTGDPTATTATPTETGDAPGPMGPDSSAVGGSSNGGATAGAPNTGGGGMPNAGLGGTAGVPNQNPSGAAGEGASGGGFGGLGAGGENAGGQGASDAGAGGAGPSGAGAGGAGGTGEVPSGECTRELLDGLLDDYFAALSLGDPSSLPLAANVKFTENAQVTEIGTTDFWMNAGDSKYSQRALDTAACSVAAQAVVPEGATDLPIALRIKVESGEMTEIETIVVREGDYTASYSVPSNTQAIIDIADDIGWHQELPEGDRASREELTAWMDKYFRAFPNGVCNVTDACRRLENGGGDFDCDGFGATCAANVPGDGASTMIARLIIVDEVRGIAAGLANFDYMADGHLDMHMMKMSGGQVHAVQAILRDTEGQSGWE